MDTVHRNFGLVIAFVIPGLVALWGLSYFSPTLSNWLSLTPGREPTIGSFLHVALGSLAVGLIVSAVRWALIDTLHHKTGVPCPAFDFSKLQVNLEAFVLSVEWYYRYYQFYSNMAVSIACLAVSRAASGAAQDVYELTGVAVLEAILIAASRDSLTRYYLRVSNLLGTIKKTEPTPKGTGSESGPGESSSGQNVDASLGGETGL
jgi:hypothetical protein